MEKIIRDSFENNDVEKLVTLLRRVKLDKLLLEASKNNHFEVVKILIESGVNVHDKNHFCLRFASERGYYEIVKLLIENGAAVGRGARALKLASENGHDKVVKLLIENRANVTPEIMKSILDNTNFTESCINRMINFEEDTDSEDSEEEEYFPTMTKISVDYSSMVSKVISSNNTKVAQYLCGAEAAD